MTVSLEVHNRALELLRRNALLTENETRDRSCEDRGNYEYDFLVFIHVGSAYPLLSQIAKDHFLRMHLLYLRHRHPTG